VHSVILINKIKMIAFSQLSQLDHSIKRAFEMEVAKPSDG
jgi:hypothetical protein